MFEKLLWLEVEDAAVAGSEDQPFPLSKSEQQLLRFSTYVKVLPELHTFFEQLFALSDRQDAVLDGLDPSGNSIHCVLIDLFLRNAGAFGNLERMIAAYNEMEGCR